MATNKDPFFLNTIIQTNGEIDNAQGTTTEVIFTPGADGGAVTNLVATTTDTSSVTLVISVNDGSSTNVVGEVTIPAGSGTDCTSLPVNVLTNVGMTGNNQNDGSMLLGPSSTLVINAKSAVTAAKVLSITATGGSFTA